MSLADLLTFPIVLGGLLLLWAFAARRSPFDCFVLGLAGLLLLLLGLREDLAPAIERQIGVWPELALGVLGLVMLVRVFLTRLGWPHRVGFGLAGCAISIPLLVLIGLVALFSYGAGHDYHRPSPANEAQANRS